MSKELTKEEIARQIADDCGSPYPVMHSKAIADAMESYAKSRAIAFASFLKEVYYLDAEGFYHHNYQNKVHFTIESLWETFNQSIQDK